MPPSFRCLCCGARSLEEPPNGSFEICDSCGWEDDPVQSSDPAYAGGANGASMNQFREQLLVHAGTEAFWQVQQHGSCLLRIVDESGDRLTLSDAVRWIADAVQAGGTFEIDTDCDEPPLVMVHLRRSPS